MDKAADSLVCTWRGVVAEVIWGGLGRCRGEEGRGGLTGLWEKIDCMGAWTSDWRKPTATRLVASDWLNMEEGERGEDWASKGGEGEAMFVIMGERSGEEEPL